MSTTTSKTPITDMHEHSDGDEIRPKKVVESHICRQLELANAELRERLQQSEAREVAMREEWKELSAELYAHVPSDDLENPSIMEAIANMQVATKPTAHNSVLEELKNLKHEVAAESARAEGYEEELVSLRARVAELEGKSLVDEITKTPYEL